MKHGPWLKMWRCIFWTWWFAIAMLTRHGFFFLKIYSTWPSTSHHLEIPPRKNERSFFGCFNNQTGQPKKSVIRQPPWSPVGIFWSSTWPSVWLTIGRPWLKDSKPRRISSLATQFFRLGIAKGKTWPSWRFFVFFVIRQATEKKTQRFL